MDALEISRITEALVEAVLEADARQRQIGNDAEFRAALKRARHEHRLLADALRDHPTLATERRRRLCKATDTVIEQLEAIAKLPNGRGNDPDSGSG